MKLNPDCIRDILLTVEEECGYNKPWIYYCDGCQPELLSHYTSDEISYHIIQCAKSELIDGLKCYDSGESLFISDLTPEGHKFIANIRSDNNWNKTKSILKNVGSESLDTIKQVATGVITSLIQAQFLPK